MNAVAESIAKLDARLECAPFDFAFIGGSALSLLVTDARADAIRVTKDIDIIADIRSRKAFHDAERLLESMGFRHDTREGAPICRWIYEGITVDVLPIREEVLGWRSRWFPEALTSATSVECSGKAIRVVSAPFFVMLKLEAFEERGHGDFLASTDFEDVICLFNGRESIVEEIEGEPVLGSHIGAKFREYLKADELDDAVEGFVQTEDDPEGRKVEILDRFRRVASIGNPRP